MDRDYHDADPPTQSTLTLNWVDEPIILSRGMSLFPGISLYEGQFPGSNPPLYLLVTSPEGWTPEGELGGEWHALISSLKPVSLEELSKPGALQKLLYPEEKGQERPPSDFGTGLTPGKALTNAMFARHQRLEAEDPFRKLRLFELNSSPAVEALLDKLKSPEVDSG
jgi:hypothetical protein